VGAGPLVRAQGWYYLLGGLWPLVHFRSFEAVAGPKPDRFQTEVTSVLFTAVGAALLAGSRAARPARPVRLLAAATALGTAYVDLRHRRALRDLFRAEALLELAFATGAVRATESGGGRSDLHHAAAVATFERGRRTGSTRTGRAVR
jgi:hypothetical protein